MKKLLELLVCDAPFRFQDNIFKHVDGIAMGNSLESILTDLWMQQIE